jgi:hypothetical protein
MVSLAYITIVYNSFVNLCLYVLVNVNLLVVAMETTLKPVSYASVTRWKKQMVLELMF